jgi:hypothetical protein
VHSFILAYGLRRERSVERYENPSIEGEDFREYVKYTPQGRKYREFVLEQVLRFFASGARFI